MFLCTVQFKLTQSQSYHTFVFVSFNSSHSIPFHSVPSSLREYACMNERNDSAKLLLIFIDALPNLHELHVCWTIEFYTQSKNHLYSRHQWCVRYGTVYKNWNNHLMGWEQNVLQTFFFTWLTLILWNRFVARQLIGNFFSLFLWKLLFKILYTISIIIIVITMQSQFWFINQLIRWFACLAEIG